jgi:penicillin-binding protein 1C
MSARRAVVLCAVAIPVCVVAWILSPLPDGLIRVTPHPAVVVLDRHGLPLRVARGADGTLARWVPLSEMDPDLIAAFLATEDGRFYGHPGIDPLALARAGWTDLRRRRTVSGGSTITMQLARLLRPSVRTLLGKLHQSLWALRLERHLDKQTILEQYLNRVPLGQGVVGVEAAAALYFAASASELSLGQAALLAGMAHAPSSDNPLAAPSRAKTARSTALARLIRQGYASASADARAEAEPVLAREQRGDFLAPHFTTRLLSEPETPTNGIWRTSLDLGLQSALESEVRHAALSLRSRGARQAALVVLDNPTGEILAWVGSPDFWADTAGQVDMVISPRQPGSALKPFLYGMAFDRGVTPATVLPDVPRVFQTSTGPYAPRNYDRRFHGPVRVREALASSFNLPAVELTNRLGAAALLGTLRQGGFGSLKRPPEYYGLGLALGNGDVTLLELANGYRALASGGLWRPVRWRVTAPGEQAVPGRMVVTARSASLLLDILSDPLARVPGFGLDTPLDFPFPAASKTGTSRHFTDNWAVAVTGRFTVAVWVGNFSGRPMDGVSGVSGAGPLLHRAVLLTADRYPPGSLPTPRETGAVSARICRLSGLLATDHCPATTEWFAPGQVPERNCDWHMPGGGIRLPAEFADWADAGASPGISAAESESAWPARRNSNHAAERPASLPAPAVAEPFRIVSPEDGDEYDVPPGVEARYATIALRAGGGRGGLVRWWVDGQPVANARWTLRTGAHVVRAEGSSGERAEVRISVN